MIKNLASLIAESRPEAGPMVVGITGIDASGKSTMTTFLAEELISTGFSVQIVHVDDFHKAHTERHPVDLAEAEQHFERGIDFERLRNEILKPVRDEGILETSLMCLDVESGTWTIERKYSVASDTIVLIEGEFLFRPDISHFLDLVIFLEIDDESAVDKAYLDEYPPERNADVIIDNNDWKNPVVTKWRENG